MWRSKFRNALRSLLRIALRRIVICPAEGRERLRDSYRRHIEWAGVAFFLGFALLWARLLYVQSFRHAYYEAKANGQQIKNVPIMPRRGRVLDSQGEAIAVSKFMDSVYIEPWRITKDRREIAMELGEMLDKPYERILEKMVKYKDRKFACLPIARKVGVEQVAEKVRALRGRHDLSPHAVSLRTDSKRVYPRGQFAAHIIGATSMDDFGDNVGREGLERQYDEQLRGNMAEFKVLSSATRQDMEPVTNEGYFSTFGHDIYLTINREIQVAAERELAAMVEYQNALGGSIVVMACRDGQGVRRGDILAMANVPTYDPNFSAPAFARRNRAVTDAIETGSVMKTFMAAYLLENNLVSLDESIDCQGGVGRFNGRWVRDAAGHAMHLVFFPEVYHHSSNVGFVSLAQRVEPAAYVAWLHKFGFGRETGVDFPGEADGRITVRYPVERDSAAIGYGVSVTALQVARALAIVGADGLSVKPRLAREIRDVHNQLVERFEPPEGHRVIRRDTARILWKLMEGVVERGTGTRARLRGYRLGGKTGTALKYDPETGKYSDEYIASFACLAPINEPRVAIYCYVDEPKREHYGGSVAAPVVKEVAHVALRALGVVPAPDEADDPVENFDIIVDPIRTRRASERMAALARNPKRDGRMPDLRGMTMMEAQLALKDLPLATEFEGSGVVSRQRPAPDEPIEQYTKAFVEFARPTRN